MHYIVSVVNSCRDHFKPVEQHYKGPANIESMIENIKILGPTGIC